LSLISNFQSFLNIVDIFFVSKSLSIIIFQSSLYFHICFKIAFSNSQKSISLLELSNNKFFKYSILIFSEELKIKYKSSFFNKLKLLKLSINFLNKLIVAVASLKALCHHENGISRNLQIISRFNEGELKNKKFARKKVSITILFFILIHFCIKKFLSKKTLCQSNGVSHIKFIISFFISSKKGASCTSESKILVIFDIISGILIFGLIKVENESIISKFS
jgi:hypothetical protein